MNAPPTETGDARLDVTTLHLRFRATRSGVLPEWMGSTWRGAFGRALKQLACVTGLPECRTCPLFTKCDHARIFETPPDPTAGKMRKYNAAPHPYALLPASGGTIRAGQPVALEVRLFGRAEANRKLVLDALNRAANRGLGPQRIALEQEQPEKIETRILKLDELAGEPVPERVEVHLVTPLRLRAGGRLAGTDSLEFGSFFSVLLRRVSMLCTFHQQPFQIDFRALVGAARQIQWRETGLRLERRARFSSRQGSKIDMSGLTGRLVLNGRDALPFWPWLKMGEHTLLGKGTVMGLGRYELGPV